MISYFIIALPICSELKLQSNEIIFTALQNHKDGDAYDFPLFRFSL
jgi:hypothetical protein